MIIPTVTQLRREHNPERQSRIEVFWAPLDDRDGDVVYTKHYYGSLTLIEWFCDDQLDQYIAELLQARRARRAAKIEAETVEETQAA